MQKFTTDRSIKNSYLENILITDFTLAEYVKMQKSCSYERESIKGQREDTFFIKFN